MVKIKNCIEKSEDIKKYSYGREDSKGRLSKMCMWNYAGNDILGMVARSQRIAGTAQELMGGDEVYHYHSKVGHLNFMKRYTVQVLKHKVFSSS